MCMWAFHLLKSINTYGVVEEEQMNRIITSSTQGNNDVEFWDVWYDWDELNVSDNIRFLISEFP